MFFRSNVEINASCIHFLIKKIIETWSRHYILIFMKFNNKFEDLVLSAASEVLIKEVT